MKLLGLGLLLIFSCRAQIPFPGGAASGSGGSGSNPYACSPSSSSTLCLTGTDPSLISWTAGTCPAIAETGFDTTMCYESGIFYHVTSGGVKYPVIGSRILSQVVIDGGGSAISGTQTLCVNIAVAATINRVTLIADASGNATVDLLTVAYSSYTGIGSASSITASAIPAISSAVKYQDSTLTGWSKNLAANSVLCYSLTSPATIKQLTITVEGY